ncbi:hypothetical protein N7453_012057 [Penicillium expansum]|nr:hypothetical protein N7453_012057 [Penicillium expansum]
MSDFNLIAFDQTTRLRADLSSGNLEGIRSTLSELRYSLNDETLQAKTVPLLREAVERYSYQLVECFLQSHVALSSKLVLKATINASYQTLEVFLTHGWDINAPVDSNTPAALTFSFYDFKLTQWFLAYEADSNRRCYEHTDQPPLSVALEKAPFAIIELLLDHSASLQHGQVIHYAAMRELDDRLEVLQYLLDRQHPLNDIMYQNCGDEYYFHMYSSIGTPLHYGAGKELLDYVTFLVQHGASIEIRDPLGQIAADWARRYGHSAVFDFLQHSSAGSNTESNLQFTDAPGCHFKTASLQEVIRKNGFRLV